MNDMLFGKGVKGLSALLLAFVLLWQASGALACTAVYIGAEASADGTVIIAKSNDAQKVWPNYVKVDRAGGGRPRADHARG